MSDATAPIDKPPSDTAVGDQPDEEVSTARRAFRTAAALSLGLLLLGVTVGAVLDPGSLRNLLRFDGIDLAIGVAAAFPLLLVLYLSADFNLLVLRTIGPAVASLSLPAAILAAIVFAVLEELFFRGVLQSGVEAFGFAPMTALILANVAFAAGFAASRQGFIGAFLVGCYLSAILLSGSTPSLLRPILAHALFNLALVVAIRSSGARLAAPPPDETAVAATA